MGRRRGLRQARTPLVLGGCWDLEWDPEYRPVQSEETPTARPVRRLVVDVDAVQVRPALEGYRQGLDAAHPTASPVHTDPRDDTRGSPGITGGHVGRDWKTHWT